MEKMLCDFCKGNCRYCRIKIIAKDNMTITRYEGYVKDEQKILDSIVEPQIFPIRKARDKVSMSQFQ